MQLINFDLDHDCCRYICIWKSIHQNHGCLYRVYILVAKLSKLKLINRTMVVKHFKTTRDTSSNLLMVAKHLHRQLQFIFQPLKIGHHLFASDAKCCKTFVLTFMCCIAIIWIAFDQVWIVCMSTILKRLDATTKTHAKNMRHCAMYAKPRTKLKNSDPKVL